MCLSLVSYECWNKSSVTLQSLVQMRKHIALPALFSSECTLYVFGVPMVVSDATKSENVYCHLIFHRRWILYLCRAVCISSVTGACTFLANIQTKLTMHPRISGAIKVKMYTKFINIRRSRRLASFRTKIRRCFWVISGRQFKFMRMLASSRELRSLPMCRSTHSDSQWCTMYVRHLG